MGQRVNKYNNRRVVVDNCNFHSKAEARRYEELRIEHWAGHIENLELQPRFRLHANGIYLGSYIADFRYLRKGIQKVEDVKGGPIPPLSRWKIKHTESEYSIKIDIVRMR